MKVLLISAFLPSKYNIKGPTFLPYQLSKYKPKDIEIDLIFYRNELNNEDFHKEDLNELFTKITNVDKKISTKNYVVRIFNKLFYNKFFNSFYDKSYSPNYKLVKEIKKNNYDLIWIYPSFLFDWYKFFKSEKVLLTGPDCSFLHYKLLKEKVNDLSKFYNFDHKQIKNIDIHYKNSFLLESLWAKSNALLHVVGQDDKIEYERLGALNNVIYIPHPYQDYKPIKQDLSTVQGKITILVSGDNKSIYFGHLFDEVVELLIENFHLAKYYKFLFLGKNFDLVNLKLSNAGFEVEYESWVQFYEDKISEANVQIIPVVIGTGTKNKTLQAFAGGLYCIGTNYAFENIAIDCLNDCSVIRNPDEVIEVLKDILVNKDTYANKALSASSKVKILHSPFKTGELFWSTVRTYWKV